MRLELVTKTKYCPQRAQCQKDIENCVRCKKYLQYEKHIYDVITNGETLPPYRVIIHISPRETYAKVLKVIREPTREELQEIMKILKTMYSNIRRIEL